MRNKSFIVFCLVILSFPIQACINESSVTSEGKRIVSDLEMVPWGRDHTEYKESYEKDLTEYYSLWKEKRDLNAYNDYGVHLIYLGRYEEAKMVFQEIEKIEPHLYSTAANIGTVYELLGKNDSALYWIKEGVRINPAAHDSSEWLHVKILEAKIKGDKFITSDFLTGTDFGNDVMPSTRLSAKELKELGTAIFYQLSERISFIRPKERIVALLLFELGNITSYTEGVSTAIKNYDLAREYGYASEVMNKRQVKFAEMHEEVQRQEIVDPNTKAYDKPTFAFWKTETIAAIGILALLLAVSVIILVRRRAR